LPTVTEHTGTAAAATGATASGFTTTGGVLLVALVARSGGQSTGALSGITDSAGNTWLTATRGAVSGVTNTRLECWYAANAASVTSVVFASGTSQTWAWDILEITGMATATPVDVASPNYSGTTSSTTVATPAVTTLNAADVIIASFHCNTATPTAPGGSWTNLATFDDGTAPARGVYQVVAATGSYSATWTLSAAQAAGVLTVGFAQTSGTVTNAPAGLASGTGSAPAPTVSITGGAVSAPAGLASGSGAALDATTSAATGGGVAMGAGFPYLGYPGSLMLLPSPAPGYEPVDLVRGATHELLAGGNVRDRIGCRRRFTLNWPTMSDASYVLLRSLTRLPGPYRYMDPLELNLLTVNQSIGTDELRTTEGFSAFTQGTVSSSTAFARSWSRSLAWATGTALAAVDRGIRLFTDVATIDPTWAAVRPSTQYAISGYLRSTAAVSMSAGINWYDAAGVLITSVAGSGVALSTSNFNTRVTHTAISPSNAAYGVGKFLNTTTTGSAITVYFDELQLEEGTSPSSFRLGVGTPLVSVDSLGHTVALADATVGFAWHAVELVLLEL
jgi:hypothetical protein